MGDKNPGTFVPDGNESLQQQQQSADNSELRSPDAVRKAALARLPAELRHRVKQQS